MADTDITSEFAFKNVWQIYITGLRNPGSFGKRAQNSSGIRKPFLIAVTCILIYVILGIFARQPTDFLIDGGPVPTIKFNDPQILNLYISLQYVVFYILIPMFLWAFCGVIIISICYYLLFRIMGTDTIQMGQIYKIILYPHAFLVLSIIPYIGSIIGAIATVILIYQGISSLELHKSYRIANFALALIYFIILNSPFILRAFINNLFSSD
jgi:hypothetical protein